MFSIFTSDRLSTPEAVDMIESFVYEYLKPHGFRKHGRTLHRYVDGDISQVVNLQSGRPAQSAYDVLWVNLGIRVPECAERTFTPMKPPKRYYHEYDCNIRTRLGSLVDGEDTFYNLSDVPSQIGQSIVDRLRKYALPIFEALNSRDAILAHRAEYPRFDLLNGHMILLEEAMMAGKKGDISKAAGLFRAYYQNQLEKYHHALEKGAKAYLKKGERVTYRNTRTSMIETVTAAEDGYVTLYNANRSHLTYLEKLAQELGIELFTP